MPDLSVVVVSYNVKPLLLQCLRSLRRSLSQFGPDVTAEIFVVDNDSRDGSASAVAEEFPNVTVIANKENRGFAAATNQGLRQSAGRYYWLLNPDTLVLDDAARGYTRFMDAHPDVGACGGKLVGPDGSFQQGCFAFPTLAMTFIDFFPLNHRLIDSRLNGRYPRPRYDQPFRIGHPLGASLVVRKEAADQIGLLDERFFIYCEEVDWCFRLDRAGWPIYYTPDATVVHLGGQSAKQSAPRMLYELHKSRQLLFEKNYGPLYAALAHGIVRLGIAREWVRWRREARRGVIGTKLLRDYETAYREIARL